MAADDEISRPKTLCSRPSCTCEKAGEAIRRNPTQSEAKTSRSRHSCAQSVVFSYPSSATINYGSSSAVSSRHSLHHQPSPSTVTTSHHYLELDGALLQQQIEAGSHPKRSEEQPRHPHALTRRRLHRERERGARTFCGVCRRDWKARKRASGGHQEAIRRSSGRHQEAIRSPPRGHQEGIERASGGHQEGIRRAHLQ